jgi:hypothetical protein
VIGAGPIFRGVRGKLDYGDLDVDDPASNQHNSELATATQLLHWFQAQLD